MIIKSSINTSKELIKGLHIISPKIIEDKRGFFYESWNKEKFESIIKDKITFTQDNHTSSYKGVIRGLHYQIKPRDQAKLIRCTKGQIFDIAVDIRKSSPTFGHWLGIDLNDLNKKELWIPSGFAHGFITISNKAEVLYKTNNKWSQKHERSIKWDDKDLAIDWPIKENNILKIIISKKDNASPSFREAIERGDIFK